jgi:hypothetical protein
MEVRAISQLDDRALPTLENEIFGEILRQFREMTHS